MHSNLRTTSFAFFNVVEAITSIGPEKKKKKSHIEILSYFTGRKGLYGVCPYTRTTQPLEKLKVWRTINLETYNWL